MSIYLYLGNLEFKDILQEEYVEKVLKFLEENGFRRENSTSEVKKKEGNYHIFDIPREIHICGEDKTMQFAKFLQEEGLTSKFTCRVGVVPIKLLKGESNGFTS